LKNPKNGYGFIKGGAILTTKTFNQPVYVIVGPTASGKSDLALQLALDHKGVLINADSLQIYEDLPLITAQPSAAMKALVPHKLYGVLKSENQCDALLWVNKAIQEIKQGFEHNLQPILVGGTGLYLKALMEGLSPIPPISKEIREDVLKKWRLLGPEKFHDLLQSYDPFSAQKLSLNDLQRRTRALEVVLSTHKTLHEWYQMPLQKQHNFQFRIIALFPERQKLYERCNARFLHMLETGALEEVKLWIEQEIPTNHTLFKAVGVREIKNYLEGLWAREEMIEKSQQSTRNYAKRQMTWFKNQLTPDIILENVGDYKNYKI
jgi:tRNA dimethylallyltransferase